MLIVKFMLLAMVMSSLQSEPLHRVDHTSGIGTQAPVACCPSCRTAASNGHIVCYRLLEPAQYGWPDRYNCICLALHNGHVNFAQAAAVDWQPQIDKQVLDNFIIDCVQNDDTVLGDFLQVLPWVVHWMGLYDWLVRLAAKHTAPSCLQLALNNGAIFSSRNLIYGVRKNCIRTLDVVLAGQVPIDLIVLLMATSPGRVQLVKRLLTAGCPTWDSATDEDACNVGWIFGHEELTGDVHGPAEFRGLTLVVANDIVRAGPMLLLAAQKGAPLTARMQGMLGEVRRRAQAVAWSFHRATSLGQVPGGAPWAAMGWVPLELVMRIATLARVSLVVNDLVE
jgi:hypothetical protein